MTGGPRTGSELAAPRPPGFFEGLLALPGGLRFILQRRQCWPVAAVPVIPLLVLALPVVWFSIAELGPWFGAALLPSTSTWYEQGARWLLTGLASVTAAFVGLWLVLILTPTLSAPAMDKLVRLREQALGAPARPEHSLWFELRCGLEAQLGGLLLSVPLWALYWTVALLVPGFALLLFPLHVLPLALGLAWNLLDYPLTLRGVRLRERWALLRSRPAPVLGFGLCLAALSWVPGAALLFLPAGVVAAAGLAWRLLPEPGGHILKTGGAG